MSSGTDLRWRWRSAPPAPIPTGSGGRARQYRAVVVDKLPLDSPLWDRLSSCHLTENAIARLREVVATRHLGEAWRDLCDEILHQGSVCGVSSAAIPHLVDVAPYLSVVSRRDLWIEIRFLVTAGADHFPSPPAPGLQEGLTGALRVAEVLAVRDFLTDTHLKPEDSGYYALACVALAGHRVGRAMWEFPLAKLRLCAGDLPQMLRRSSTLD